MTQSFTLQHLARFDLSPVFQTVEEVEYWLSPRNDIVTCYVVEVRMLGQELISV